MFDTAQFDNIFVFLMEMECVTCVNISPQL